MTTFNATTVAQQPASPPMYDRLLPDLMLGILTACVATYMATHLEALTMPSELVVGTHQDAELSPRGTSTLPPTTRLWQPQPFLGEVGSGSRSVSTVPRLRPSRGFASFESIAHLIKTNSPARVTKVATESNLLRRALGSVMSFCHQEIACPGLWLPSLGLQPSSDNKQNGGRRKTPRSLSSRHSNPNSVPSASER
ncbi:hypothetical protein HDV57DRAFT_18882 [Trichoderma longibrachiatum]|uniref:Uncharacterized protein n=1 Tax=Trichoderma longibrachiatum ATCC 18648 TaxID=983965 RepID=A0A2T4CIW1_TRILO|nr:hypothetical protein M440DRAFT_85829 [Trichoderma longibrachiatum ATCC 18648]